MRLVLVVEDDTFLRTDAVGMLVDAGLNVVELDNADDALAYTYEHSSQIAAIFTDVQMPGHTNGFHLAGLVARHWPHIVVLVCSGRVMPSEPLPGNVRFMPKPWRPGDVLGVIRQAVAAAA